MGLKGEALERFLTMGEVAKGFPGVMTHVITLPFDKVVRLAGLATPNHRLLEKGFNLKLQIIVQEDRRRGRGSDRVTLNVAPKKRDVENGMQAPKSGG